MKVARFRPTHGANTTMVAKRPTPSSKKRRRHPMPRATRVAGIKSPGTNRSSSARTSASQPQARPSSTATTTDGRRMTRMTANKISAMKNMAGVSDIKMPLGIQKFGATAASTAAVRPTHGPATARPSRPTQRTTADPSPAMASSRDVVPPCNPTRSLAPPRRAWSSVDGWRWG